MRQTDPRQALTLHAVYRARRKRLSPAVTRLVIPELETPLSETPPAANEKSESYRLNVAVVIPIPNPRVSRQTRYNSGFPATSCRRVTDRGIGFQPAGTSKAPAPSPECEQRLQTVGCSSRDESLVPRRDPAPAGAVS